MPTSQSDGSSSFQITPGCIKLGIKDNEDNMQTQKYVIYSVINKLYQICYCSHVH